MMAKIAPGMLRAATETPIAHMDTIAAIEKKTNTHLMFFKKIPPYM